MHDMDHYTLERISFMLITSRNQKARRNVLKKNIGPRALPELGRTELELLGFTSEQITWIKPGKSACLEIAEKEVEKMEQNQVELVFREDLYYPEGLGQIYDPPDFIYVRGNKELLKTEKLAVVGSRHASSYGRQCINQLLPGLCKAGLTIVSGMAYGIDSMAHDAALKVNGGTIGVNPGGFLHLYPPGNIGLINQVMDRGCIISEFAMDIVPRPFYFPIRNRIIAGISRGIMVVEAALKSGSLITARLGLEQNRDIFAVPGRIDSPVSQGTHFLIQQGAKLVTSTNDILQEFGFTLTPETIAKAPDLSPREKQILELMPDNEVRMLDHLVDQLDDSVSAIISVLMGLLLKGIIIEESGGYRRVQFFSISQD